jgi:hypothetical protein
MLPEVRYHADTEHDTIPFPVSQLVELRAMKDMKSTRVDIHSLEGMQFVVESMDSMNPLDTD